MASTTMTTKVDDSIPRETFFASGIPSNIRPIPIFDNVSKSRLIDPKIVFARPFWLFESRRVTADFVQEMRLLTTPEHLDKLRHKSDRKEPQHPLPMDIVVGTLCIARVSPSKMNAVLLETHKADINRKISVYETLRQCLEFESGPDPRVRENIELERALKHIHVEDEVIVAFGKSFLDGTEDGFYSRLGVYHGRFSMATVPLVMRTFLHRMNRHLVVNDLFDVAMEKEFEDYRGRSNDSSLYYCQSVKDMCTITARGDYSCYPLTDELVACIFKIFLRPQDLSRAVTSSTGTDVDIMSQPFAYRQGVAAKTDFTNRTVFTNLGVSTQDMENALDSSHFAHAITARDYVFSISNQNTGGMAPEVLISRMSQEYRLLTAPMREIQSKRLRALVPFVVPSTMEQVRRMEAYVLAAVNAYVSANIAPALQAYKARMLVSQTSVDSNWLRFSLDFDYIDNLSLLAAIYSPEMVYPPASREATILKITNAMFSVIKTNNVRHELNGGWIHFAKYDTPQKLADDSAFATFVDERLDALKRYKDNENISDFIRRTMQYVFPEAKVVDFEKIIRPSGAVVLEPIVDWRTTSATFILIDPDFHAYYCLYRLLIKLTPMTASGRVAQFEYIMNSGMFYDINVLRMKTLHERLTLRAPNVLGREVAELIRPHLVFKNAAQFVEMLTLHENKGELENELAELPSIHRVIPRFKKEHRQAVMRTFLRQLISMRVGDTKQVGVDMDILMGMVSGAIFATCSYTQGDRLESMQDIETTARITGLMQCNNSLQQQHMYKKCIDIGAVEAEPPNELIIIIPLLKRKPVNEKSSIKFLVELQIPFRSPEEIADFVDHHAPLEVTWLWEPSRDPRKRTFVVVRYPYDPRKPFQQLDVPHKDGYEGVYTIIVGSERHGYMQQRMNVRIRQTCVRTNKTYEEVENCYGNAVWKWPNSHKIENIGWNSATSIWPYISTFSATNPDLMVMSTKDLSRSFGDALFEFRDLYKLFFNNKSAWFEQLPADEDRTERVFKLVNGLIMFMMKAAKEGNPIGEAINTLDASGLVRLLLSTTWAEAPLMYIPKLYPLARIETADVSRSPQIIEPISVSERSTLRSALAVSKSESATRSIHSSEATTLSTFGLSSEQASQSLPTQLKAAAVFIEKVAEKTHKGQSSTTTSSSLRTSRRRVVKIEGVAAVKPKATTTSVSESSRGDNASSQASVGSAPNSPKKSEKDTEIKKAELLAIIAKVRDAINRHIEAVNSKRDTEPTASMLHTMNRLLQERMSDITSMLGEDDVKTAKELLEKMKRALEATQRKK